jgi:hypothetical protein
MNSSRYCGLDDTLVLVFIIAVTFAPSAAASDARREAAGDATPSSRPSNDADGVAPPAPERLVGLKCFLHSNWNNRTTSFWIAIVEAHEQTLV